jgi:hypothetical protein
MKRALVSSENGILRNAIGCVACIFIVPVFLVIKLVTMPFEKSFNRSPDEVAQYLRDFLDGTGGEWDWDDFTSIPIADPRLEDIRERAAALELPMADQDTAPLKDLIAEAEAIAAHDQAAAIVR